METEIATCDVCRKPFEDGDVLSGECWRCSDEPAMIEWRNEHTPDLEREVIALRAIKDELLVALEGVLAVDDECRICLGYDSHDPNCAAGNAIEKARNV
jgi:hypothetical protein